MKLFVALAVFGVIAILSGCTENQTITHRSAIAQPNLKTLDGMCNYLSDIPTVKSVTPWENPYGQGVTITTRHYEINTTLLDLLVLGQVPGFMESALVAYKKQLPNPIETKHIFKVYLFGSRDHWEQFTRTFVGENAPMYLNIQKGAYYLNGSCVAYNIGRTRTFAVLGHEGWHQFNSRHFKYRLPSWLDEGIATLFESSVYVDGLFYFKPDRNLTRLGPLREILQAQKMIPLEKLIALNPGEVVLQADSETVAAFYAQSYALTRFLREENYGKRLGKYHNFLLGAANGSWPLGPKLKEVASNRNIPITAQWNRYVSPKLFAYYIDPHYALMEDEYLAFCRKIVYNVRPKR